MNYAAVLPTNLRVQSALYEMDGMYYLYLQKGNASYERYSRACIQAMEFGTLYGAEEAQILPIQEHGNCLIAEKALQKLR
jgi:negative regulator of genetic competence, sporulation and motility